MAEQELIKQLMQHNFFYLFNPWESKTAQKISIYHIKLRYLQTISHNNN